jgi:hypothetical protein
MGLQINASNQCFKSMLQINASNQCFTLYHLAAKHGVLARAQHTEGGGCDCCHAAAEYLHQVLQFATGGDECYNFPLGEMAEVQLLRTRASSAPGGEWVGVWGLGFRVWGLGLGGWGFTFECCDALCDDHMVGQGVVAGVAELAVAGESSDGRGEQRRAQAAHCRVVKGERV